MKRKGNLLNGPHYHIQTVGSPDIKEQRNHLPAIPVLKSQANKFLLLF